MKNVNGDQDSDLGQEIQRYVDGSNDAVMAAVVAHLAAVVAHLAAVEIDARKRALVAALVRRVEAERALAKVRPQPMAFDAAGKPVGEPAYTAAQNGERKKLIESIKGVDDAVRRAFGVPSDWSPIKKLGDKSPPAPNEKESGDDVK